MVNWFVILCHDKKRTYFFKRFLKEKKFFFQKYVKQKCGEFSHYAGNIKNETRYMCETFLLHQHGWVNRFHQCGDLNSRNQAKKITRHSWPVILATNCFTTELQESKIRIYWYFESVIKSLPSRIQLVDYQISFMFLISQLINQIIVLALLSTDSLHSAVGPVVNQVALG